ncbi:MAG TPA: 5-(carboxyamino)imidazole ribonucleotide mutase [Terriglobia bacterium]|nr:5-(carboxyamino)imidazole ribonucleotide mutase [Terriglobia bacterium]
MSEMGKALVGIIMGSDTDLPVMKEAAETLQKFGVPFEIDVTSAHRSPARTSEYARTARDRGLIAIIVGAGGAAHLAGVVAAETTLPVIGVPMPTTSLQGMDSLLSTVQMPAGIPVATVAIGKSGAVNAAVLAVQILGTSDAALAEKLASYKKELAKKVLDKSEKLKREFSL